MAVTKNWYKLDNVGKFYASTANVKVPVVFRFSAILKEEIDANVLQEALNKTGEVFPSFNVNLRKGFFWYYLNETNKINKVTKENLPVCFKVYNNSDDFLYRVSYFKRKINFEISHILSDGKGGLDFFRLLVTNYINLRYNLQFDVTKNNNSLSEKTENSFNKYYEKTKKPPKDKEPVYIYKSRKFLYQTQFMECHTNVQEVLRMAHDYNTTLTGFLISVLIYSFKDVLRVSDLKKTIKIIIPVDLRSYFKSSSAKNFFGVTTIAYKFNSKEDTFDEIIKVVSEQLKENLIKEKLLERVNMMVAFEKNWFCRFVPVNLKNFVLKISGMLFSDDHSSCLSNTGVVKFESPIDEYIESVSFLTATEGFQFSICSFKDDLCIGISNNFIHNEVIKNFCRYFSQKGLNVRIDLSEVEQ